MMNKGFICDFVNYIYVLYDLKDNTFLKDNKNYKEEIYFIKMKNVNVNVNDNESNTSSEGKTHMLFLLHNNNLIYNLY